MNRTVRRAAQGLRRRNEFEDLLRIYDEDKGSITLPQRLALQTLASFEESGRATAELDAHHAHREAVAQAVQVKGPKGIPSDAAGLIFPPQPPQPHR